MEIICSSGNMYVTKVNRLKVPDGTLTTNDRETGNVLNEFFASVFDKEGDGDLPFFLNNNMLKSYIQSI